jgi:uncharacterized membrane protein YphA (DoxX/SURF4 family)
VTGARCSRITGATARPCPLVAAVADADREIMLDSSVLGRIGRVAWGTALAALGGDLIVARDFLPELFPAPAWLPARGALACALGAVLVVLGLAIAADRRTRTAARLATAILWLAVLGLHLPLLVTHPGSGGEWTCAFEVLAIGAGGAMLAYPDRPDLGRIAYAISLPVFGVLHFVFRAYVASVIPGWLPGPMFWACATGVLHIAAGLAILTGIRAQLAARLAGAMFASWVILLHIPRALALGQRAEWTSLCVALAMCGAGWLVGRVTA